MPQTHEVSFEQEICEHLAANGWLYSPNDAGYDAQLALFPRDLWDWLQETQPDELAKRLSTDPVKREIAKKELLKRLTDTLDKGEAGNGGSLQTLRRGLKDHNAKFKLMEVKPEISLNAKVNADYAANRLRVMRQVHYSLAHPSWSIDLVFFLNGIPVATAELKTDFTQSVQDAVKQYQHDRPPAGEPLLGYGTRALVHFAISNSEVEMTTKLDGAKTRFLPFNRGNSGHAGNGPDEDGGSPTTYLWRDILQRDRFLEIIGKFVHYETEDVEDARGRKTKKHTLIFPRYHQLDAVTKLLDDARSHGPGQRYLIQHSAGSGKTRSIAWSAHRLATLHDQDNRKVFDTVIVVTDRNVLDAQLQEAILQIEQKTGVVAAISSREAAKNAYSAKSAYLADMLSGKKPIIVVTIQTFPYVLELLQGETSLAGRRFAVIADEAHSSQTGQAASKLKETLSEQELATLADGGEYDVEDVLASQARARADTGNITFLAFTATPKPKTLEMFGTRDGGGLPHPFHTYTMAQAIEEGFILDVLQNYTTYKTAYELAMRVENGEMRELKVEQPDGTIVERDAGTKALLRWVKLHPTNIAQKVEVIIEHFEANVKHLLGGRAKAMVVTDSRKAAVRYKLAMDKYLAQRGYATYTSLVAFSGSVSDPEIGPEEFTESTMNPGVRDLRQAFKGDEYRVMIVANKFQTGFDQPLLCAMYVDRQLSGVTAVQTLSRLNRAYPGKSTTMVLDFVNRPEEILAAFEPYYEEAAIESCTDPNLIHDLQTKLDLSGMYSESEVDAVVDAVMRGLGNNKINGACEPARSRFLDAWTQAVRAGDEAAREQLDMFRRDLRSFVKLFDFLSQIINFDDTDVEKRAIFFRALSPLLRSKDEPEIVDLSAVELTQIAQRKTGEQSLPLESGTVMKPASAVGSGRSRDPEMVLLQELVDQLNSLFSGEDFKADYVWASAHAVVEVVKQDEAIQQQAAANSRDQFLNSTSLRDAILLANAENAETQGRVMELVHSSPHAEKTFVDIIGKLIYEALRAA